MKKSLLILTAFLGLLLSSCVQPEEQQERESAIRDSAIRDVITEREMQKQEMKQALQDTLKTKDSELSYYQEAVVGEKVNLEYAKDQLRVIQQAAQGKPGSERENQIKDQTFKISSIEESIANHNEKIKLTQEKIDQLKTDLMKYN